MAVPSPPALANHSLDSPHHHNRCHHSRSLSTSSLDLNDHSYRLSLTPSPSKFDHFILHNLESVQRPKPVAIADRRSLPRTLALSTVSVFDFGGQETMSADPSPGSPPALSSSRSSIKSSSFHSSPSHEDLSDASNFEDISLSEDIRQSPTELVKKEPPIARPVLRTAYTTTATPQRQTRSSVNLRDLTTDLRATATLNNHAQKHSPLSSWQPTFAPSSPTLSIPYKTGRRPSSPTKSPTLSSSPGSVGSATPRPGNENSPILNPSCRGPWQQTKRKTAKELEDEYHDSDDELPEDAFVWNIPLSPRPLHARSTSVSPEREKGPERGSLVPRKYSRTKSWTAALRDLSEDAQKLTTALEQHFDKERQQTSSSPSSTPASSPRPSLQHRSKSVALPPVQRNHALIDPLPASKEKEKVLTRTRPSWLPPKCPKEEKKHLKEYQRMMSKFVQSG